MKKTAAIGLLLLWRLSIWAQTGCSYRISGKVLDPSDSAGIPFAEIFIENGHLKSRTDQRGNFVLERVCPGKQILEFDKTGFYHLHVELKVSRDTTIVIFMDPVANISDTVRVHAAREKPDVLAVEGKAMLSRIGEDLSRTAESLPGVEVLQGGRNQSKPMARGMYGLRLPIFSDRLRMEGQAWGNDHNPEADARSFDHMELVKDASVLKWAHDAPGGALVLSHQARPHNGESNLDQSMHFGSNGRQLSWAGQYTRKTHESAPSLYLSGSARKAGNYSTPDLILDNTGLEEYSASAGRRKDRSNGYRRWDLTSYRFEGGIFQGTRAASTADLLAAINRPRPLSIDRFSYTISQPRQVAGHATAQLTDLKRKEKSTREWTIGLQYDQRREFDYHRNSSNRFPQLDLILFAPAASWQTTRNLRPELSLTAGSQFTGYIHRFGGFYFLPDFTGLSQGAYSLLHWHRNRLTHTLSARLDGKYLSADVRENGLNTRIDRSFLNYSMAYSGMISRRKNILHWHLSRMWRAPWVNELYSRGVHHGSAAYEQGYQSLGTEKSYRAEAEWQYQGRRLTIYFSPSVNYLPGFINLTPMAEPVLTIRGAFPGYEYLQADALFTGADAFINAELGAGIHWKSRFSYLHAIYLEDGRFPAFIPPARVTTALEWNRKSFHLKIQGMYVARQTLYNAGTDFLPPPPSYFLADLEAGIKDRSPSDRYDISVGVNNLLNQRYRSYLDRFRYFTDMPGRNVYLRLSWRIHHHIENHH